MTASGIRIKGKKSLTSASLAPTMARRLLIGLELGTAPTAKTALGKISVREVVACPTPKAYPDGAICRNELAAAAPPPEVSLNV